MSNKTYFIIMSLGLFAALLFALYPQLDLIISGYFYAHGWSLQHVPFMSYLRNTGMFLPFFAIGLSIYFLIFKRHYTKIALFWLSTLVLAPGLIVNVILKDNWHRARPVQILEFGGKFTFTPWYQPGNPLECVKNCSFVSGEASGAFWLLAVAAVVPLAYRNITYTGVIVFACLMSFLRLAYGGHFMSDLFISALITYSTVKLIHYLIFEKGSSA